MIRFERFLNRMSDTQDFAPEDRLTKIFNKLEEQEHSQTEPEAVITEDSFEVQTAKDGEELLSE